jgi:hypothetical protein
MSNETTTTENPKAVIAPCAQMGDDLINAGTFVGLSTAVASLQAYLDAPGTPTLGDPGHIFGHTFGLNNLRTLLFNIDLYNSEKVDDEPLIKGIRVYYGIDKRNDASFPMNPPNGMFRDLIFMPVVADGSDLFPIIRGIVDPQLILSGSRPCPNECGTLTFIQKL